MNAAILSGNALHSWSRWPLELTLAATVCLGLAWGLDAICRRRSAAFRAHLWLIGFAATAVWSLVRIVGVTMPLPVLPAERHPVVQVDPVKQREPSRDGAFVPVVRQASVDRELPARAEVVGSSSASLITAVAPSFEQKRPRVDWRRWAGAVWLAGMGFAFARIAAGMFLLRRSSRRAQPIPPGSVLQQVLAAAPGASSGRLRLHPGVSAPVSFGLTSWWVLFPLEAVHWDATRVRLVCAHEFAHCERRDHLAILFLRVVAAVCWFHPLAWIGLRRFRLLCESAADDRALEQADATTYAAEVFRLAEELRGRPVFLPAATLSIGQPGTLRERVVALLDATRDRRRVSRRLSTMTAVVALVLAVVAPSVRPVRAQNAATPAKTVNAGDSKPAPKEQPKTREFIVSVRDALGVPIAGAQVKPTGLRVEFDEGSLYEWTSGVPQDPVTTDAAGRATLQVPIHGVEDLPTIYIAVDVWHPDYCLLHAEISLRHPERVQLQRGGSVEVRAEYPDHAAGLKACAHLCPPEGVLTDAKWKPKEGTNGVMARVPPGKYALLVVAFDAQGHRYYGEPVSLEVTEGQDQAITSRVRRGITMKGRLSAEVPRPVTGGRVMAEIISEVVGGGHTNWAVSAPVRADGTFELEEVPKGAVHLIAMCDGFVSQWPPGEKPLPNVQPQAFDFSKAGNLEVAMVKTGTVRMTVVRQEGPVPGAEVSCAPNQIFTRGSSILGQEFDQGVMLKWAQVDQEQGPAPDFPRPPWKALTDADGEATISNLPPGEVSFMAKAEGLRMPTRIAHGAARREAGFMIDSGNTLDATMGLERQGKGSLREELAKAREAWMATIQQRTDVVFDAPPPPPSRQTGKPFAVTPGGDFTGRVVDESGAPLGGVLVDAWTGSPGDETRTDAEGRFRLKGLYARQQIEVKFSLADFSPVHVTRQPVGDVQGDVVLSKRPYFEGVVRDSQRRPVPDQLVRAATGEKEMDGMRLTHLWHETRTDKEGRFRLYVSPDEYEFQVRSAAGEVRRFNGVRIEADMVWPLDIRLTPGATFRAHVIDATTGKPVAGVKLDHREHPGIEGTSDAEGNIAIPGMFPGDFEFEVHAEKTGYSRWWSANAEHAWQGRDIDRSGWQYNFDYLKFAISPGDEPVRVIEMEKGVKIRGVVRSPEGQAVKGASVALTLSGTGDSLMSTSRFSVRSGDDGRFEMLLPASNGMAYNLVAHDGDFREWRTYANAVTSPIKTTPGQEIEGVEIVLSKACVVRGQVVDRDGKALAQRYVTAASSDLLDNRYYFPTTRTKADGSFELRFVRPGKNYIQVATHWRGPKGVPEGATVEVEASPEHEVAEVKLTAGPER